MNGDLSDGGLSNPSMAYWTETNGHWSARIHRPLNCSPSGTFYLQMDDDDGFGGWPVGGEDWIYQVVSAPLPHTQITLRYEETHHILTDSLLEISIYGREANGPWNLVFTTDGSPNPPVKACRNGALPFIVEHFITPSQPWPEYMLEIYAVLSGADDAWLGGDWFLGVQ